MATTKNTYQSQIGYENPKPSGYFDAYMSKQGLTREADAVSKLGSLGYNISGSERAGYTEGLRSFKSSLDSDPTMASEFLGKIGLGTPQAQSQLASTPTRPASGVTAKMRETNPALAQEKYGQIDPALAQTPNIPSTAPNQAQINPSNQAPQTLIDQVNQASQQVATLEQQYRTGANLANQTGVAPSSNLAGGKSMVENVMGGIRPKQEVQTTPQVDSFYMDDKNVTAQAQELIDFLSPPSTQQMLIDGMKQIQSQQAQLAEDKLSLMNLETVMGGTEDDLRKEIEASSGLATDSQVKALAISRNSTLLKQASYLQNKISMQQDLIANSTQLLQFEKEMANTQFSQRLGVMQYVQQNNERMYNAFRDSVETIQKTTGWAGLKAAYAGNPRQLGYVESLYGGAGSLDKLAAVEAVELAKQEEERRLDIAIKKKTLAESNKRSTSLIDLDGKKVLIDSQTGETIKEFGIADKKADERIQNAVIKADVILTNVNTALKQVGSMSTGLAGGITKNMPGSTAYNLNKTLTTIKANIGFQELQAMRQASPTGGALGQVAVQELEALQAVLGSLDIGQGQAQLTKNIQAVQTHYKNWLQTVGYEVAPNGDIIQITE